MEPNTFTEFAHLKIPLEEIRKATNNFAEKKIIGKGGFGNVYKGKITRSGKSIKIAARRLGRNQWQGDVQFWTEISMLATLKHGCIVDLIGYCDENGEKIVVNRLYPKGSLVTHLGNPTYLTWSFIMSISTGVAGAMSYIHNELGRSYYIIHRNINSFTILIEDDFDWEIKLSGFEHSIKHSIDQKEQVYLCEAIGTKGYMDPTTETTKGVTHKSDIYSFGVVLFEMLCGRKSFQDNELLASLAKYHYENGTLREIIRPDLWDQMNSISFELFSEAAYSCLHDDRSQRPDASKLYDILREASDNFVNPPREDRDKEDFMEMVTNPDAFIMPAAATHKVKNLEHLRMDPRDIISVLFSQPDPWQTFGQSKTYLKRELECVNREYLLSVKGLNKDELPKKQYTVMMKVIDNDDYNRKYGEEYSFTEIDILSSCNHENIECFLGFRESGPSACLVSKFVSANFLLTYLDDEILTWEKRLKICIDVARGLNYLHNEMEDQKMVIHRNIRSKNIVLDNSYGSAKILGFSRAVFLPSNLDDNTLHLSMINKSKIYMDPEYVETGKLKRESDVFSFGIVMLEILCGMPAKKLINYEGGHEKDLAHLARRWLDEGMIKRMMDRKIKVENVGNTFLLYKGPNEDSSKTFITIMYQCLEPKQNQRPMMQVVIKQLEKALSFQENNKGTLRMPFEDIRSATNNFSNCIGGGGFGGVFRGEVAHGNHTRHSIIVAKKLDKSQRQGEKQFYNELQILYDYKHENVVGLVGYSDETDEKIIVYEHASNGSLDKHLNNATLTWRDRLKICIDVVTGLDFLHAGVGGKDVVIHRDIKTANILLFDDWKAKLGDFGLSLVSTIGKDSNYAIDRACGTKGYVDESYLKSSTVTIESDIYSLGVVLFEILYGKEEYAISRNKSISLLSFIKHKVEEEKEGDIIYKGIKDEIRSNSLNVFLKIMYKCLDDDREKRPTSKEVLAQLKNALELQEEDIM